MPTPDIVELHPDLEEYVVDDTLYHPLVHAYWIGSPRWIERANEIYESKSGRLTEAIQSQDWHLFVFLHERPYRLDALAELINDFAVTGEHLWPVVGDVWTDTESVRFELDNWRTIWSTNCPGRELVMTPEDRERLRLLPDESTIWRGVNHEDAVRSFSWTLDRDKAVWFARRFAADDDPMLLARGSVSKTDILALFTTRDEAEIVALPENVPEIEVLRLDSKEVAAQVSIANH